MSPVSYADAMSDVRSLSLTTVKKVKIEYGNTEPDEYVTAEHVVNAGKHILRAFTAKGRLIAVADYGNGQARFSNHDKALENLKKQIARHIDMVADQKHVRKIAMY